MHAVFIEVDVEDSVSVNEARKHLQENAPRFARENGARAAYWLAPQGGRGVSIAIFDSADEAQKLANQLHVGESPRNAPPGVTFRTIEVREVLASL
ncbi:MAG TPA: hypothetical protein VFA63_14790 [Pseudonocardiaceae bacterium]|jgi:hypothetical protein|nr:hypothetical protein [Pseudonocardiaceae bacterium]